MTDMGTERIKAGHTLPMVIEQQQRRPLIRTEQPDSAFVTQLIAARDNLAVQRVKRRAGGNYATAAYATTGASTIKRMPAGYRKSQSA